MNTQTYIDEGREMVERLLARPQIPFQRATMDDAPDKPGIYLFSNQATGESIYVGRTKRGIKRRMNDHWNGSSSFTRKGLQDIPDTKEWLKEHVSIRWLTEDKLGISVLIAEHFAIGALRPVYNR